MDTNLMLNRAFMALDVVAEEYLLKIHRVPSSAVRNRALILDTVGSAMLQIFRASNARES